MCRDPNALAHIRRQHTLNVSLLWRCYFQTRKIESQDVGGGETMIWPLVSVFILPVFQQHWNWIKFHMHDFPLFPNAILSLALFLVFTLSIENCGTAMSQCSGVYPKASYNDSSNFFSNKQNKKQKTRMNKYEQKIKRWKLCKKKIENVVFYKCLSTTHTAHIISLVWSESMFCVKTLTSIRLCYFFEFYFCTHAHTLHSAHEGDMVSCLLLFRRATA